MFGCGKKKTAVAGGAKVGKCPCGPGACKTGMIGLTALSMFGPSRFRPHAQNILAVIGIVSLLRQIYRRSRSSEA